MGSGALGTESAGYYLRNHSKILGKIFGKEDFAFLVHARLDHGKESAKPCWFYPDPKILNKILHPIIWFMDLRKLIKV